MRHTIIAAALALAGGIAAAQTSPNVPIDPRNSGEVLSNPLSDRHVDRKQAPTRRLVGPRERSHPARPMTSGRSEAGKTSGQGDDDSRMQSGTSNGANSGTGDTRGNTTGNEHR